MSPAVPMPYNGEMIARRNLIIALLAVCLAGCDGPGPPAGVAMVTDARRDTWQSGEVIRTPHYRIFSTVTEPILKQNLPGFMEAAYDNYLSLTGLSANDPDDPLDMYVLGTRSEWASLTEHRLQEHSKLYLQLEAGGYCLNGVCVLWDIGPMSTMSVASHEGLHQFFWHNLAHRIPMWAEEGLCATAEGLDIYENTVRFTPEKNVQRYTDLRKAIINGYWVKLEKLLPMDAGDAISGKPHRATGYYGQVWSLVLYIRSRPDYRNGFYRMLQDAREGRLHEAAGLTGQDMVQMHHNGRDYNKRVSERLFRHYITDDLAGFKQGWLRFAQELVDIPLR